MIYHNTITRTAKTALAPFYALTHEILRHPLKPLKIALMSFTGVNGYAPDWLAADFRHESPSNHQNTPLREGAARTQAETVNGNGF